MEDGMKKGSKNQTEEKLDLAYERLYRAMCEGTERQLRKAQEKCRNLEGRRSTVAVRSL